jgi:hypothetical protein
MLVLRIPEKITRYFGRDRCTLIAFDFDLAMWQVWNILLKSAQWSKAACL